MDIQIEDYLSGEDIKEIVEDEIRKHEFEAELKDKE